MPSWIDPSTLFPSLTSWFVPATENTPRNYSRRDAELEMDPVPAMINLTASPPPVMLSNDVRTDHPCISMYRVLDDPESPWYLEEFKMEDGTKSSDITADELQRAMRILGEWETNHYLPPPSWDPMGPNDLANLSHAPNRLKLTGDETATHMSPLFIHVAKHVLKMREEGIAAEWWELRDELEPDPNWFVFLESPIGFPMNKWDTVPRKRNRDGTVEDGYPVPMTPRWERLNRKEEIERKRRTDSTVHAYKPVRGRSAEQAKSTIPKDKVNLPAR
ncbi:hypothetical protein IAT38_001353 [Cryptococcus sp. DSM 104549]